MSLKGKAAAIGIGELKPLKDPGEETPLGLMAKVSAEAIADAGLEKKDIDGFLVGMPFADPGMIYPAAAAERGGLHAGAKAWGDLAFGQHRAAGDAAAERLGQRHHVGRDAKMLIGKPLAGPSAAGLHFVKNQQQLVLVAKLPQAS